MVGASNGSIFLQTIMFIMNQSSIQDTSYNYYYLEIGKETNATKCYGIYGCFPLSKPWTSEHRPVSLFPEELEKVAPRYPLYTRNNPKNPILFDLDAFDVIQASGMDTRKPVYLISHGYMEGGGIAWIGEMTQELLRLEDCNVIVVDWHGGSSPPYTQAVANIRLVGAVTAHLLLDLSKYTGENLDNVHCIGHSLGAHMCGYVGYTLQEFNIKLGRITGLDPAEPHFAKAKPPVRLDRSAAQYVDVIHTDASQFIRGGLGMTERIGHVDYYPNGGTNQPGCGRSVVSYMSENDGSFFKGFRKYLGCNHLRSYEFFIESINLKCSFLSVSCSSYEDFVNGKCFECGTHGEKCIRFGYHSKKHYNQLLAKRAIHRRQNLVQYLITGDKKPFCRAHYRVTVKISGSEKSRLHKGEVGQLSFVFHSTSDKRGAKTSPALTLERYHEPGETYIGVLATDEIRSLKAVQIEWVYNQSLFNPLTWRIIAAPRIYIASVTIEALEINEKITVCLKANQPLISGIPQFLLPGYC